MRRRRIETETIGENAKKQRDAQVKKIERTRGEEKTRTGTRPKSTTSEEPKIRQRAEQTDGEEQRTDVNIQISTERVHLLDRQSHEKIARSDSRFPPL